MRATIAIMAVMLACVAQAADIVCYSTNAPATATGTATNSDVLIGVTYSSAAGTGLTGTRYPALVPKTGQTTSYAAGDDGDLEKGVAWPVPRFTICANTNCVQDNLTGLHWTLSANMASTNTLAANVGLSDAVGTCTWASVSVVMTNANVAAYGGRTDWRIPNEREIHSLTSWGYESPCIPNAAGNSKCTDGDPFIGIASGTYWTSTTRSASATSAVGQNSIIPTVTANHIKTTATLYVWLCAGPD